MSDQIDRDETSSESEVTIEMSTLPEAAVATFKSEPIASTKPEHLEDTMAERARTEISKDISALYGLLAVVLALCIIPLSEVIEGFNTAVLRWAETANLTIAILFLLFCFAFLFRPPKPIIICGPSGELTENPSLFDVYRLRFRQLIGKASREEEVCVRIPTSQHLSEQELDSGSLYLKVGCMFFAMGSLVYSCLTLGVYAESYACFETTVVLGINPVLQILFITLQLIFIFRNSRFTITKYRTVGRLGIMHMVVLDLIICLRVIVDETLHEFGELAEHENPAVNGTHGEAVPDGHHRLAVRSGSGGDTAGTGAYLIECNRGDSFIQEALRASTIFLYPCIIEYALISAGILFTMWRGLSNQHHTSSSAVADMPKKSAKPSLMVRARTAYRIDCDQAVGGLFAGLLIIVLVLVGLILFFIAVGSEEPHQRDTGVLDWLIMDIGLNALGLAAVTYCFVQFARKLDRFEVHSVNIELDDTLLMFSMIGVYAYGFLSLMGSTNAGGTLFGALSQASATLMLVQATVQTLFLFDSAKRGLRQGDVGLKDRPGKQTLTFLLVLNFAMWAVDVFCAVRPDGTPHQRDFYGAYSWTVMIHATVPLMIFYRFHSTACIFEVWKRAYREPKKHLPV